MSDLVYVCKPFEGKTEVNTLDEIECKWDDGELHKYKVIEVYTVADDEDVLFVLIATWKVNRGILKIVNNAYDISELIEFYSTLFFAGDLSYDVDVNCLFDDVDKHRDKCGSGYNVGGEHIFNCYTNVEDISDAFDVVRENRKFISDAEIVVYSTEDDKNVIAHYDMKHNTLIFNSCYIYGFERLYAEYKRGV